jgi:hypothetical protein
VTWREVFQVIAYLNIGGLITHMFLGSPGAAFGHLVLLVLTALVLGALPPDAAA